MKKLLAIFILSTCSLVSFGQMAEIGYNTIDLGAEFQYYKDGKFIGFHVASNAKLHHSFHAAIGYYSAGEPSSNYYINQNNGGLGIGVGYRYYTMLRPHHFFIGVNANLFTNKVKLNTQTSTIHTSKIFIPSLQTGYMFLFNDMVFITPSISVGYKTNLDSAFNSEKKKVVGLFGISAGFKF